MSESATTSISLRPFAPSPHHEETAPPSSPADPSTISSTTSPDLLLRPVTLQRQISILISAFLAVVVTIGFNQSYGVFQNYYTAEGQEMLSAAAHDQAALIAFVGTLGAGLTWAGSVVVNPLMARVGDWEVWGWRGHVRWLTVAGVAFMSGGFFGASFATEIWHLVITQGLLYGIGSSLLYFPIISTAPEYFNSHRGAAIGFVLSGAGIGGLILAPTTRALLTTVGPRWTLRSFALLNLLVSLPIALTASPSRIVSRRNTHIDLKTAKRPAFLLSICAAFLQAAGNLLPLTFLVEYSLTVGYSASFGAVLLAVSNGVNSVFRILAGYAGDRFGRQNTLIFTVIISAATVVSFWLRSTEDGSQALWILFVVFYGAVGAGYNALFPTTVVDVFGLQAYASVTGFITFVRGIGAMLGSPIGGRLLGNEADFRSVVWFDFALLGGAALCVVGVRFWDAVDRKSWRWKA